MNKALAEIQAGLALRVTHKDFKEALNEQTTINEAICSENCVARWLWKSGALINGFAVPWEVQSVNTCP